MELDALRTEIRRLRIITAGLLLAVVALGLWVARPTDSSFTSIDVERINVVESDGRYAVVIANADRLPGAIADGREITAPRHAPGILFYNHMGGESGGLIFRTQQLEDGRQVGYGHLSFDQYDQNQVIALQYMQNIREMRNGLRVIDRPTDMTIAEVIDLQLRAKSDEAAARQLEKLETDGAIGADRVFLGSRDRLAALELKDRQGKTRIHAYVTPEGDARIDFLNAAGEIVRAITAED